MVFGLLGAVFGFVTVVRLFKSYYSIRLGLLSDPQRHDKHFHMGVARNGGLLGSVKVLGGLCLCLFCTSDMLWVMG